MKAYSRYRHLRRSATTFARHLTDPLRASGERSEAAAERQAGTQLRASGGRRCGCSGLSQRWVKRSNRENPSRAKSRRQNRISIVITPIRNHPFRFRLPEQKTPGLSSKFGPMVGGRKRKATAAIYALPDRVNFCGDPKPDLGLDCRPTDEEDPGRHKCRRWARG